MIHGRVFSVTLHVSIIVCGWFFWSQLGRVIVCGDVEVRCRLSCGAERTAGRGGIRPAAEERPDTPLRDSVCKRAHMQMCYTACEFVLILYMVRHTFILICMCSLVCSMWEPVSLTLGTTLLVRKHLLRCYRYSLSLQQRCSLSWFNRQKSKRKKGMESQGEQSPGEME